VLLDIAERNEFWEKVSAGYANGYEPAPDDEYPEYAHLGRVGPIPPPPEMVDDIPLTVHDR
jgi:hypothetical protein